MFTSGVVNSEDDQLMPDRLRERLTILAGRDRALARAAAAAARSARRRRFARSSTSAMTAYRAFLGRAPFTARSHSRRHAR